MSNKQEINNTFYLFLIIVSIVICFGIALMNRNNNYQPPINPIRTLYHPIDNKTVTKIDRTIFSLPEHYFHDQIHKREQNSTVILFKITKNKMNNLLSVDMGTGVVISNSATIESNSYNTILTAGHLMYSSEDKELPSPCSEESICLVYNSRGEYLGQFDLLERADSPHGQFNKKDKINTDIISLYITPENEKFDSIPGVELNSEQKNNIFFIKTQANSPNDFGSSYGLSGGGVFNNEGKLIGILTTSLTYNVDNYNNKEVKLDNNFLYYSILPLVIQNESDDSQFDNRKIKNIYQKFLLKLLKEDHFDKNDSIITPINNNAILNSLGNANKNIIIKKEIDYKLPLTLYGFPAGNAMEYNITSILVDPFDDNLNINNIKLNFNIHNDFLFFSSNLNKILDKIITMINHFYIN